MEEWKDVVGYEGIYKVSNQGRVLLCKKNKFLSQRTDTYGYKIVTLYKCNQRKDMKVHRLVAFAFIDNPNNYPQINHKDEIKDNNCVDNLEWVSNKYNANYGTRNKRISDKQKGVSRSQGEKNYFYGKHFCKGKNPRAKAVGQFDLNGNLISIYDCTISAAESVCCSPSSIGAACRGERDIIKGFRWKYIVGQATRKALK